MKGRYPGRCSLANTGHMMFTFLSSKQGLQSAHKYTYVAINAFMIQDWTQHKYGLIKYLLQTRAPTLYLQWSMLDLHSSLF